MEQWERITKLVLCSFVGFEIKQRPGEAVLGTIKHRSEQL